MPVSIALQAGSIWFVSISGCDSNGPARMDSLSLLLGAEHLMYRAVPKRRIGSCKEVQKTCMFSLGGNMESCLLRHVNALYIEEKQHAAAQYTCLGHRCNAYICCC